MFKIFMKLRPFFRPYRRLFWTGFTFMITMHFMSYIVPKGIGLIWDRVFPHLKEPGGIALLAKACGLLVLVALIRAGFVFVLIDCFWATGTKVVKDLRMRLYEKLQRLPFSFYDASRSGDLMSRLTLDIEMVRNFYAFMIEHRVQIWLYFIIVSTLLLWTDWQLALACLAISPLVIPTVIHFSSKTRKAVVQRQIQAGLLNTFVQENITGIRVVKAFAMEDTEIEKFERENRTMLQRNLEVTRQQVTLQPLLILGSTLGVAAILWFGGIRVAQGTMTIGTFISFMAYLALLNWPMTMLAPNTNMLRQAEGSVERLLEILNKPELIQSPPGGGAILPNLKGTIEFKNVTFGYEGHPILKSIRLQVKAGEKVAIIGLTGSGKTTLINLIPRFYDPQSGTISVDGIDLRELDLGWWRRQIGLVLQETFLFSASIGENIAFGRMDASQAEIEEAARLAQIHDFISSLPDGYHTVVGERGVGLSGGQKQRIAIARALLLDPKLLILDDSTSNVDLETESAIQASLQKIMADRTTLIITQRLSSAKMADRIIILESGEIRAQGSHEQLLDRDDFYRQLYSIQSFQDEEHGESA